MQEVVVALLGLAAAVYLGRKLYRTMTGKQSCSCSGTNKSCSNCSSCPSCSSCSQNQHKSEVKH